MFVDVTWNESFVPLNPSIEGGVGDKAIGNATKATRKQGIS